MPLPFTFKDYPDFQRQVQRIITNTVPANLKDYPDWQKWIEEIASQVAAPPSAFVDNFTSESWAENYSFPEVNPQASVKLVEGGGLEFTQNLAGWVVFLYKGYQDSLKNPTYLHGRMKLAMHRTTTTTYWLNLHRWIDGQNFQVSGILAEGGGALEQFLSLWMAQKAEGITEGHQQIASNKTTGELWLTSELSQDNSYSQAVWDVDPDAAGSWGRKAVAFSYGVGSGSGQEGAGGVQARWATVGISPSTTGGVWPGFAINNPRAGDIVKKWEISPVSTR